MKSMWNASESIDRKNRDLTAQGPAEDDYSEESGPDSVCGAIGCEAIKIRGMWHVGRVSTFELPSISAPPKFNGKLAEGEARWG